ncbi:MAG: NAD(P)H-dependent oxidoreductase subunit E [Clostridia bacterium]|nr:NAD(P)H-dependent oxidoreductase subunit E [Clostridia bacterium]
MDGENCENCVAMRAREETLEMASKYPKAKDNLMAILNDIQVKYGYIPEPSQAAVAEYLDIPLAEVYGVITFYSRFTTIPKGKYDISVCLGTACFVKGSSDLLERAKSKLGIDEGQTTDDQMFSLETMRCVGACGLAPVFTVNDKVYGNATVKLMDEVIDELKNQG